MILMEKMDFVILAAGRGERLWPITNHIPKTMVRILKKPLLIMRNRSTLLEKVRVYMKMQLLQHNLLQPQLILVLLVADLLAVLKVIQFNG